MAEFGKRVGVACALVLVAAQTALCVDPSDQLQFADGLFSRGLYDLAVREYQVLVDATNAPQADAASYRIGEARSRQNQTDAARAAYQQTVQRFPGSPYALRARFRLAESEVNAGRYKDALTSLRDLSAIKKLPDDLNASTWYYLGYAARRVENSKEAETAYQRLLDGAPASPYATWARVDLAALRMAENGNSVDITRLLEDAAKQTAVPRAAAEALLALGDYTYRQKDYSASAEAYARLFASFPDDTHLPEARLPAAWAFLKADRAEDALRQLPFAQAGKEASWLYLEANANRLANRNAQARASYEALIKSYPASPEFAPASYEWALLLYQQRDFSNAYIRARDVPETDETRGDIEWLRAETARETGRADEAVTHYDRVVAGKPNRERASAARFQAARLRQDAGAWVDASDRYRALVNAAPKDRLAADALFASAFCRSQAKEYQEALTDWARLLTDYPQFAARDQVMFGKAQAELALEKNSDAAASLQELLKTFPNSPLAAEAHLIYGSLLEQEENFSAAEFHFNQALRKNADAALARRIQFRRLAVLQRQGRTEEAIETLNGLVADGAAAEVPVQLLDWAARWNLEQSNFTASVAAATALAEQQVSPGWTQIAWYLAGRAQLGLSKDKEAGASFKKSANVAATTAEGLEAAWRWGEWAAKQKNWDEAKQAFEQAAERAAAPETAEIRARSYYGLGRVAEGQGRWADAARQYLAVAVLYDDPNLTPDALDGAARMFAKNGDASAAEQARQELNQRYPNDPRTTPREAAP